MTLVRDGHTSRHEIGSPLLGWTSHPWHVAQEGAFGACSHFLDCVQRGVPAETSGEDNLKTFALVDAAYEAAATHAAAAPKAWQPETGAGTARDGRRLRGERRRTIRTRRQGRRPALPSPSPSSWSRAASRSSGA